LEMAPLSQDLLAMTLRWDPGSRISVYEALLHPYLEKFHCPEDEPVREALDTLDFEFERRKMTAAALREEIFRETLLYHPSMYDQYSEELHESGSRYDICNYRLLMPGESPTTTEPPTTDDETHDEADDD